MNPDDVTLLNTSQQFEYERMSREIDEVDDVEELKQMCKFLVKMEMQTRETYSVMLQDLSAAIIEEVPDFPKG
jgi:hypothetical protein